jgi:hypothetical protein
MRHGKQRVNEQAFKVSKDVKFGPSLKYGAVSWLGSRPRSWNF